MFSILSDADFEYFLHYHGIRIEESIGTELKLLEKGGPYDMSHMIWPISHVYRLYNIAYITWAFQCTLNSSTCSCVIDTVSIISISVKDDAMRRERSSLAIRSLLLLIDLNKEITIISVDESEDVPKAISPIRNTSCSPVEFSSLSPQPDLIDPVPSLKAWLTRQIIRPAAECHGEIGKNIVTVNQKEIKKDQTTACLSKA